LGHVGAWTSTTTPAAAQSPSVIPRLVEWGVGECQLRRLFHQHLGASPIAVAQTRRVLLAKQLIHETHLPMTEIAMAAGFGSLRRFNGTFLALFRRPPTALRRAVAPVQGEVSLLLRYRPPYDWPAMLCSQFH